MGIKSLYCAFAIGFFSKYVVSFFFFSKKKKRNFDSWFHLLIIYFHRSKNAGAILKQSLYASVKTWNYYAKWHLLKISRIFFLFSQKVRKSQIYIILDSFPLPPNISRQQGKAVKPKSAIRNVHGYFPV